MDKQRMLFLYWRLGQAQQFATAQLNLVWMPWHGYDGLLYVCVGMAQGLTTLAQGMTDLRCL